MRIDSPCALDLETTGVERADTADPRRATFVCAAVAPAGIVTFQMPTVRPGAKVVVHNVPYDPVVLGAWDAEWDDTKMIAHLAGEPDTTLKGLTARHLGRPAMPYGQAEEEGLIPEYCLADAVNTWELLPILLDRMPPSVRNLYDTLERPLLPLWAKMTMDGAFYLHHEALRAYQVELSAEVEQRARHVQDMLPRGSLVLRCTKCGIDHEELEPGQRCEDGKNHAWKDGGVWDSEHPVNVNSPTQLLSTLQGLGLPLTSTAVEDLQDVAEYHPVVDELLAYRHAAKKLGTYVEPWQLVPEGQRLGGVWRPTGTGPGRVSSAKPNLMNIPHDLERFFHGGEGHCLLTFDNGQLEVRVLAHVSGDLVLQEACRSGDVHGAMQKAFGLDDRGRTKVWVFGTMYTPGPADDPAGISAIMTEARKHGEAITRAEAIAARRTVQAVMPGHKEWCRSLRGADVVDGLFGAIHIIPPGNPGERWRKAVNWPIQGGAGRITKKQMLVLHRAGYEVVRQVHDDITVRVPLSDREDARREVPRLMEGAVQLDVPIVVEEKT